MAVKKYAQLFIEDNTMRKLLNRRDSETVLMVGVIILVTIASVYVLWQVRG